MPRPWKRRSAVLGPEREPDPKPTARVEALVQDVMKNAAQLHQLTQKVRAMLDQEAQGG